MNTSMAASAFNSIDYFVLVIFGISILMGYMRGLLIEVISLGTLIAATFISSVFSSKLAAIFSQSGGKAIQRMVGSSANIDQPVSLMAICVSFVGLFVATLIVGFIVKTVIVGITQGPNM